jgi:FkbM family methyltransferase
MPMTQSSKTLSSNRAETTSVGTLNLRLSNGTTLALPPSLETMTTYVVLEQETWFEKELAFLPHLLKPGMSAIDIGANIGLYSLAMARFVAPGRVYAYEPGSDARALLEKSRRLNQASNLEILPFALSDGAREGHLRFGDSSELNALAEGGRGENVRITSLDIQETEQSWAAPDFVKIDAEGEEKRILAGGRGFFARHSPLVMFEIKVDGTADQNLRSILPNMGYRLFRLLPGLPVLVPLEPAETLDLYEINLFAAKPDRAAALAQAGLLVENMPDWQPNAEARSTWLSHLMTQAFAPVFKPLWESSGVLDPEYRDVLAAYGVWRRPETPVPERCAALGYAYRKLYSLCERATNFARLSTLARVAWEAGERRTCVEALRLLFKKIERIPIELSEPFWPACSRFDAIAPNGQTGSWFITSVVERNEVADSLSSYFSGMSPRLDWLCQQPFASIEMERRRALIAARAQGTVGVPERLRVAAPDHLNAEVWRSGAISRG